MVWVGLLGLLQLGVLQTPTITIGQAVLLQGDIITHLAVLLLEVDTTIVVLPVLQVDTTTVVLPVLPVDTITIVLPVLPVDTITIGLPAPLQVDTPATGQQPTVESRSLSG
jgi:hypothetical protein